MFGKKKLKIEEVVRKFIESKLPTGVHAFNQVSDGDKKTLIVSTRASTLDFELAFDNDTVDQLTDEEKHILTQHITIPALEALDKALFEQHKIIEAKLKELKNPYE